MRVATCACFANGAGQNSNFFISHVVRNIATIKSSSYCDFIDIKYKCAGCGVQPSQSGQMANYNPQPAARGCVSLSQVDHTIKKF